MQRYIRRPVTHELVQVISRFVNKEFRIATQGDREEYLARAEKSLERMDCQVLGFALMSSHIHWVLIGGRRPLADLFRSLHSGFARHLNFTQDRLGPVFADRFRPFTYDPRSALRLLAYVHNNPVRAGVVTTAGDSHWTSHRAYAGMTPAPAWLDVPQGLALCGFEPQEGHAFDAAVRDLRDTTHDTFFADASLRAGRKDLRRALQLPVELATSRQSERELELPLMLREGVPFRTPPNPIRVIDHVCERLEVPRLHIAAKSHVSDAVAARRVSLMVWEHIGGSRTVMAQHLGISDAAAAMLLSVNKRAVNALRELALEIAGEILNETDPRKPFLKFLKSVH